MARCPVCPMSNHPSIMPGQNEQLPPCINQLHHWPSTSWIHSSCPGQILAERKENMDKWKNDSGDIMPNHDAFCDEHLISAITNCFPSVCFINPFENCPPTGRISGNAVAKHEGHRVLRVAPTACSANQKYWVSEYYPFHVFSPQKSEGRSQILARSNSAGQDQYCWFLERDLPSHHYYFLVCSLVSASNSYLRRTKHRADQWQPNQESLGSIGATDMNTHHFTKGIC